MSDLKKNMV
jgi:hypothetical protein